MQAHRLREGGPAGSSHPRLTPHPAEARGSLPAAAPPAHHFWDLPLTLSPQRSSLGLCPLGPVRPVPGLRPYAQGNPGTPPPTKESQAPSTGPAASPGPHRPGSWLPLRHRGLAGTPARQGSWDLTPPCSMGSQFLFCFLEPRQCVPDLEQNLRPDGISGGQHMCPSLVTDLSRWRGRNGEAIFIRSMACPDPSIRHQLFALSILSMLIRDSD